MNITFTLPSVEVSCTGSGTRAGSGPGISPAIPTYNSSARSLVNGKLNPRWKSFRSSSVERQEMLLMRPLGGGLRNVC